MNTKDNYGLEEASMAQMDDSIGALLKHVEEMGEADNTIVIFTTDNGAEVFTWPDGGMNAFQSNERPIYEGGFRDPAMIRWPGKVEPGSVETGSFSGLDWIPTLAAAAGDGEFKDKLLKAWSWRATCRVVSTVIIGWICSSQKPDGTARNSLLRRTASRSVAVR